MVKVLLIIAALLGLGYYIINYHSPFQTEVTEPYYVEIRVNYPEHDVQMVGVGKMNSYEDCKVRSAIVWAKSLEHLGEVKIDTECKKELPNKFLKLFSNQQASASYVAFDKGQESERDARFLIYGIPSSYVAKECEKITQKAKEEYSGKVYCIRGSVG
jgi:hypothetical protein